jgi:hypothetical protein
MTPEQWSMLTGRLIALEALVLAIARTAQNQDAIEREFETQKEALTTAMLDSGETDADIEYVAQKVARLKRAAWGPPVGNAPFAGG